MFRCKELLSSCIVLLHLSFTVCQVCDMEKLRKNMKTVKSSWCDLMTAERDYVIHMLNEDPERYSLNSLAPLGGISFPVGNSSKEILDTICVIKNYLKSLPEIIENLTLQYDDFILNVNVFHNHFQQAIRQTFRGPEKACILNSCQTNVETSDDYTQRLLVIRIIYFSRLWVKSFTGIQPCCKRHLCIP